MPPDEQNRKYQSLFLYANTSDLSPEKGQQNMRKIWPSMISILDVAATQLPFMRPNMNTELLYGVLTREMLRLYGRLENKSMQSQFETRAYRMMDAFMMRLDERIHKIESGGMPGVVTWYGSANASANQ